MSDLIGQTVSYNHKGVLIEIKVLNIVHRKGQAIYKLFYPLTKKFGEALVEIFNQRFKSHPKRTLEKKWKKGAKGKIKSKNIID
jgi:hypothetical protein